jgi:formylglycine-generating enzyme required for sulfatase activity
MTTRRPRLAPTLALALGSVAITLAPPARTQVPPSQDGEEENPEPPTFEPPAEAEPLVQPQKPSPVPRRADMLRLPGGTFHMGTSAARAPPNEKPRLTLTLPPFWLDRTEVSVGAYRTCVEQKRCARTPPTSTGCTYALGDPELPVTCVPWHLADAYCRAQGKRLPSEAEWEYAARGTLDAPYPWGGWRATCVHAVTLVRETTSVSCSGARPARIGTHPLGASVFGVLDMAGNVEEWTADFYVEVRTSAVPPRTGASHVLRGGGWMSPPSAARTTSRDWGSELEAGPNVGFRCARGA